jgi:hypothetical protein
MALREKREKKMDKGKVQNKGLKEVQRKWTQKSPRGNKEKKDRIKRLP